MSILEVLKNPRRFTRNRTDILMEVTLRYGDVVELPHPFEKLFVASHPIAVKQVLLDRAGNYAKSSEYEIFKSWIGNSIIVSEGDIWMSDRRMLQPGFHRHALSRFERHIEESVDQMLMQWKQRVAEDGHVLINTDREMTRLTLHIIGKRLFGKDLSPHLDELAQIMEQCQEHITQRMLTVDWARYFTTPRERIFRRNRSRLVELIELYLNDCPDGSVAWLMAEYRDAEGNSLSHDRRVDQILGFLAAGYETSAAGLTWSAYLLSEHPWAQTRIRERGRAYATQVFEETIRLYPPIPCFARVALEEDEIQGFHIPRGGTVVLPQYVTHRRPDLWKDAEIFDPERFGDDRRDEIIKNAYYPFGLGPRVCIGQGLAMLETSIAIEKIVSAFDLLEVQGDKPGMLALLSLRPDRPVILRCKLRPS